MHRKNKPAFGRIFYTEGKSLIFYAYDLNEVKLAEANLWPPRGASIRFSGGKASKPARCTKPVSARFQKAFPFYTLRHSCAARWLAAGIKMVDVADQLGHSVSICEKYYGHLTQGHVAQAMRSVAPLELPAADEQAPRLDGTQAAAVMSSDEAHLDEPKKQFVH